MQETPQRLDRVKIINNFINRVLNPRSGPRIASEHSSRKRRITKILNKPTKLAPVPVGKFNKKS